MKKLYGEHEYLKQYMVQLEGLVQKTLTTGSVSVSAIQSVC